jgi:hypothetical protein
VWKNDRSIADSGIDCHSADTMWGNGKRQLLLLASEQEKRP